jgi:hypothetical protein
MGHILNKLTVSVTGASVIVFFLSGCGAAINNMPGATVGGNVTAQNTTTATVQVALDPSTIASLFGAGSPLPKTLTPADASKAKAAVQASPAASNAATTIESLTQCADGKKTCEVVAK